VIKPSPDCSLPLKIATPTSTDASVEIEESFSSNLMDPPLQVIDDFVVNVECTTQTLLDTNDHSIHSTLDLCSESDSIQIYCSLLSPSTVHDYTGHMENSEEEIIFCEEAYDVNDDSICLSDLPYDSIIWSPFSTSLWAHHDDIDSNSQSVCSKHQMKGRNWYCL